MGIWVEQYKRKLTISSTLITTFNPPSKKHVHEKHIQTLKKSYEEKVEDKRKKVELRLSLWNRVFERHATILKILTK